MSNALIRFVETKDAKELLDIYTWFIINTGIPAETEAPGLNEYESRVENIKAVFPYLVCEIDGKICGYAYAAFHGNDENRRMLTSIYITEEYQHHKVGTALYLSLLELMKLQGYADVQAIVRVSNKISKDFHEALGFNKISENEHIMVYVNKLNDQVSNEIVCVKDIDEKAAAEIFKKSQGLIEIN